MTADAVNGMVQTQSQTSTQTPTMKQMCKLYTPIAGVFDEMIESSGAVRPHWQSFLNRLNRIGCDELGRNRQEVVRLLRENGIAYNIHGDPQGVHRKWEQDVIPFIFSRADWETVSAGLSQRAALLESVLADLYGPRRLVSEGILPADLVFRHPEFLRPCSGLPGIPPHRLLVHSADIARGPAGKIWVINDHTSKFNGIGYALENRTALAQVLPEVLRECKTVRLSTFFHTLQSEMAAAAPRQKEHPRIVILSPGQSDLFYFEHAYLAAYLGYPVVQGEDLTVRDGMVWLKSLDGLKRVDIIIRQTNDWDCDPLELSQTSGHGVPGLLEAARRNNVVIANPLGTGILESPAIMAFLPRIAQFMLGEDLLLPSVPTWWCGQKQCLDHVLANLDTLIIKHVHHSIGCPPVYGSQLTNDEKAEWRDRIRQSPYQYAGQSQMQFSTAPSLNKDRFEPLHTICRLFSVFRQSGEYTVMPGGLARSAAGKGVHVVSNRTGGILKDIWVLADRPQKHASLWLHGAELEQGFTRTSILPSRMAENLFWVGRYAERTEALAKMLRMTLNILGEGDVIEDELKKACLARMLEGLNQITLRTQASKTDIGAIRPETEITAIIQDRKNPASLSNTLGFFLNAAYAVRDHWSSDTWRVINGIEEYRRSIHLYSGFVPRLMQTHLDSLIRSFLAFSGLCMESMSREHGWMLLDIGRRIERALMFIDFLRITLVPRHEPPLDSIIMEAVLATSENIITYRRRYRSYMELSTALDLLLMDDKNPRSLIYQLDRLQEHIGDLPRERDTYRLSEEERLILKAASQLRLSHTGRLAELVEKTGDYRRLDALMTCIKRLLENASQAVSQTYFSHIQESQFLGSSRTEN